MKRCSYFLRISSESHYSYKLSDIDEELIISWWSGSGKLVYNIENRMASEVVLIKFFVNIRFEIVSCKFVTVDKKIS